MRYLGNILLVAFFIGYGMFYYAEVLSQAREFEHHAMISAIYVVLVLFAIFSIIVDVRGWLKNKEKIVIPWSNIKKPLLFLVLLAGYLIVVPLLGFFTASFIFFVTIAYWLGSRNWKELILVPGILLTLVYILFVVFLNQRIISGFLI